MTMLLRFLLICAFFSCSFVSFSQRLANVRATSTGTGVLVEFTITRGSFCNGYSVWHTGDSLMPFTRVHDNGGDLCGDQPFDEFFTYVHTSPVQERTNYYRVQTDSPLEQSAVFPVFVSATGQSAMSVYPNPLLIGQPFLNLRLPSATNIRLVGDLYDRFGVRKRDLDIEVLSGNAVISLTGVDHGVYMLWLTDGANVYSAKLIVSP